MYIIHCNFTCTDEPKANKKRNPAKKTKKQAGATKTPLHDAVENLTSSQAAGDLHAEFDANDDKGKARMKRKRKSMTKHKQPMTKKDKTLPKIVPKDELTVGEAQFLARIISLTREWFNELAPGAFNLQRIHFNLHFYNTNLSCS